MDKDDLDIGTNEVNGKFNAYVPVDLLHKQYKTDFIDIEDMQRNL